MKAEERTYSPTARPYSIRTLSSRVAALRPVYLPPDPASRTSYVAGEIAQCDFWFPDIAVPVGFGQRRTATLLPVLTMVTGYSRWASAVLIPTRRREDLFARYGGEEFAIVLPEIDGYNAHQFAEKIRRIVEATDFRFEGTKIDVTISMGVATLDAETADAAALIKKADERLYEAKAGGRNCVRG